jgi:cytochrome d ubiquinol oxidase subunit II
MDLQNLWFVLIVVLWSGYFLLEGFDFGVGMLLPFLPRDDEERDAMFATIGPVWDGNEVWLVTAGGATFAAFPAWYATMFRPPHRTVGCPRLPDHSRDLVRGRTKSEARLAEGAAAGERGRQLGAAFIWGVGLANCCRDPDQLERRL